MSRRQPMIGFMFEGFREMMLLADQLPTNAMKEGVILRGLKKSARPVLKKAKMLAPKKSGRMAKALKIRKLKRRRRGDISISIGLQGPGAAAAHLVELGTVVRVVKKTGRVVGRMRAHPFLRPAWESEKGHMIDSFALYISEELLKAARKLYKRLNAGKLGKRTRAKLLK